jgi:lipid-binding SYLF domain-containing protein
MSSMRRRQVAVGGLFLYLFALGIFGGVALERIRFDRQRAAVIRRYDEAVKEWRVLRMESERQVEARPAVEAPGQEVR